MTAEYLVGPEARAQLLDAYFPNLVSNDTLTSGESIRGRGRASYDRLGVRAGTFVIRPLVQESIGYDTNAIGIRGGPGSLVVNTSASVAIASKGTRNSLNAFLSLNNQRYLSQPQQDVTTWTGSLGGTYAVGRDRVSGSYTHLDLVETRRDIGAVMTTTQPIPFRVEDLRVSYAVQKRGRFTFVPEVSATVYRFNNVMLPGLAYGQSYRDRNVYQAALTTRYELARSRNLLLVLRDTKIGYEKQPAGLLSRDSVGGTVLIGLDYSASSLFEYQALVGYQRRNYASPQYSSISGPVIEAMVTWRPTRLTAATITLRRDIEDAATENLAAYTYTVVRLGVTHDYRRNLVLRAYAEVQRADFGAGRDPPQTGPGQQNRVSQTIYSFGASAEWLINRNLRLTASHAFSDRRADDIGSYRRNVALLSLSFGL